MLLKRPKVKPRIADVVAKNKELFINLFLVCKQSSRYWPGQVIKSIISSRNPTWYFPFIKDEIFHVPQAQKYCRGDWLEWDPKITTPPGLYLTSVMFSPWECPTLLLRSINLIYGIGTFWLLRQWLSTREALTVFLFPISFFFHFLYYTDSGSTFFILFSYYLGQKKRYRSSALASAMAMLFRQTNAVWMIFIAGLNAFQIIRDLDEPDWLKDWNFIVPLLCHIPRYLPILINQLYPFIALALGFAGFVHWNGGIVLGDQSNHVVTLHAAQLVYFVSFTAFFGVSRFSSWLKHLNLSRVMVLSLLSLGLVYFGTFEHPFLLADNRHFTFYIWRHIFKRNTLVRYLVVPAYGAALDFCFQQLQTRPYWMVLWAGATVMTLVPSPLLEFRYFIIPFLFWRLQSKRGVWWIEFILYGLINLGVMYVFLYRGFTWPNDPAVQRFMW